MIVYNTKSPFGIHNKKKIDNRIPFIKKYNLDSLASKKNGYKDYLKTNLLWMNIEAESLSLIKNDK